MKKKKYFIEALSSVIFVGLGQLIKGEGKKGLLYILFFYLTIPAAVYVALTINSWLFLLVLPCAIIAEIIIWGYNIFDAYCHG